MITQLKISSSPQSYCSNTLRTTIQNSTIMLNNNKTISNLLRLQIKRPPPRSVLKSISRPTKILV
jgi:hypothetical protein